MSKPAQNRFATALAITTARTSSSAAARLSAAITLRTIAKSSAFTGGRTSLMEATPPVPIVGAFRCHRFGSFRAPRTMSWLQWYGASVKRILAATGAGADD
jgi:hypothetical protein